MNRFTKNAAALAEAVKTDAFINPIAKHRKPDGSLDVEGNMTLWNTAVLAFERTQLWEGGAPGFTLDAPLQEEPYMVFVPSADNKPRGTIIVAHGGGFSWRTGCEGVNAAYYFHKRGFNTAILSYRLIPYTRFDAIADMQRAIRILRAETTPWNLNGKIAAMGFSAGGMLSANCATHYDDGDASSDDRIERCGSKIDAAVVAYGAFSTVSFPQPMFSRPDPMFGATIEEQMYLAPEKNVTTKTPPMFIWQTMRDDGRHGMALAQALQEARVPYELHIFTQGEHGLAMADGNNDLGINLPHVAHWGELCAEWLQDLGF
ncbi:hypothetical protein FACS18948_5640 [Clostridia bacterium]|nr:hypothetical protein FACS18948_5640 [Clostridia bacterium]